MLQGHDVGRLDAGEHRAAIRLHHAQEGFGLVASHGHQTGAMDERAQRPGHQPTDVEEWEWPQVYGGGRQRESRTEVPGVAHDAVVAEHDGLWEGGATRRVLE